MERRNKIKNAIFSNASLWTEDVGWLLMLYATNDNAHSWPTFFTTKREALQYMREQFKRTKDM